MSETPLENKMQTILGAMLAEVVEHTKGVAPTVTTSEILQMYATSDHYKKLYRELLVLISQAIAEQSTFLNDIGIEIDAAITKIEENNI